MEPPQEPGRGVQVPRTVTLKIIRTSAGTVPCTEAQFIQAVQRDEPGVAQTLLNIGQPESVSVEQAGGQVLDFGNVSSVRTSTEKQVQEVLQSEAFIHEQGVFQVKEEDGVGDIRASEDPREQAADEIRTQIAQLCLQLSELGEESFLLSARVDDGTSRHVGSIKGEHFCLLREEMVKDFQNFCLGVEERPEEGDESQDVADDILNNTNDELLNEEDKIDDDTYIKMKNEQQELMDVENVTDKEELKMKTPDKPKIIVLKRTSDGRSMEVDHEYVTPVKTEPQPAAPLKKSPEDKENNTSILFLCDVCKKVFTDIKELRKHKQEDHGESDFCCTSCPRVFSLRKTYDRHLADAHMQGDKRHLCDSCVKVFKSDEELHKHIKDCHSLEEPMKCDICEQTFPDIQHLMDHRKIHFDYACFCDRCWQGFFDYLELETHVQSNCRYKEALYKCDICGKKFTKLASISKHIDTHPVHSPHVCRMCGRGFENEKELKYHKNGSHIIRPYKCEICSKTFKKKESVIEHRRLHINISTIGASSLRGTGENGMLVDIVEDDESFQEKPEFECSLCGITLSSENLLNQHTNQHEVAAEQYKCDLCDKIFFSLDLLNLHCRRDHKLFVTQKNDGQTLDVSEMKVCDWEGCNKTFYDHAKFRQHMKYHEQRADKIARGLKVSSKTAIACEICGKVLKYKSYLKAHMLSHSKDHPYTCEICGQAYPNPKRLEDHVRVHKGEKPFKCRVCNKGFTSSSLRNQHMAVHMGHKSFICDVCGKGFMSRKHFQDHMRIHDGEQPHRCEVCRKEFIYYRSLVRHMLVHVDPRERPKPYKCEYCNKEYTEVTGYKHHMRAVHTGETPFQCDICGESFHRNDKLKRHIRARHHVAKGNKELIVTTRRSSQGGGPVIVKAESENQEDLLHIVEGKAVEGGQSELHVDVIQQEGEEQQQVYFIGLGSGEAGEAYLQETQVIEGPDGTRYIIAGSGEELQVIESANLQQIEEGAIIESGEVRQIEQGQEGVGEEGILVMNDGGEEQLSTLANMATEAHVVQQIN